MAVFFNFLFFVLTWKTKWLFILFIILFDLDGQVAFYFIFLLFLSTWMARWLFILIFLNIFYAMLAFFYIHFWFILENMLWSQKFDVGWSYKLKPYLN